MKLVTNKIISKKFIPQNKYWLFVKPIKSQTQLLCCQNNKLMTFVIE